ncbi:MAG: alpha-amylase [Proteobacteria bacterium SG_bin5]|nr:alpha-amylase [Sphingomonas sp.]OQW41418.1 MAG: alpha-amylase [Proteobacteria bacterium SG_bin5]
MIRSLMLAAACLAAGPALAQDAASADYRQRPPEDEIVYFLLPDRFDNADPANDRGGLSGDRLKTGFDPAGKGFFHGGDLQGVIRRLDYIKGLGATAIWLTPVMKNKPVQGAGGQESAGYHGYWITDFTHVDPHLGSDADYKALVDAAHARGMKVYFDIVINHTADVIQYRECGDCAYRSIADYPYQRRGGVSGAAINPGFAGDAVQTAENFAKLTDMSFAYTPYLAKGDERAKAPAWLNDIKNYHNRGNSTFEGESSTYGDFVGLDDVATERPEVVRGFIAAYGDWIDRYGIDGFRIDTSKHVNREFWQAFVPAMMARAKARGIPNFHIFGEVMVGEPDSATLARYNATDVYQPLDFAFTWTMVGALSAEKGTDSLTRLFADDVLYRGGALAARRLPTFLGNHDNGRFATLLRQRRRDMSDAELLGRVRLGHALLLTLRGVPVLYYGDEQGFNGDGGDQDAREDMFGSQVASFNDNRLLGTQATTATPRFETGHPLYAEIAALAKLRQAHPALRHGLTVVNADSKAPGLFAVTRRDPASGEAIFLAFNTSQSPVDALVAIDPATTGFSALHGRCAAPSAPGSVRVVLAPLDYLICVAETK